MNPSGPSTLIVGAGIAGLGLARALQRAGRQVLVVDRRPGAAAEGVGILLTGNAIRALAALGLAEAVAAAGERVAAVDFCDRSGAPLFAIDLQARPEWGAFLCMHRHVLQGLLLDAVGRDHVRWATTVADVEETDTHVNVRWPDGSRSRHDLLVGADGVHSELRRHMLGEVQTQVPDLIGWRFLARRPAGLTRPLYMLGNGCTMLLHPLPDGALYCGAGPADAALAAGDTPLAQLRSIFGDFGGHAPAVLAQLTPDTPLLITTYHDVRLPRWRSERCVLVGDAAHACPPTLSQGAAMALEDALALAWHLAHEPDVPAALAAFEARRRPRVTAAQDASQARMLANRRTEDRQVRIRDSILRTVGEGQLAAAWAPLMLEAY